MLPLMLKISRGLGSGGGGGDGGGGGGIIQPPAQVVDVLL